MECIQVVAKLAACSLSMNSRKAKTLARLKQPCIFYASSRDLLRNTSQSDKIQTMNENSSFLQESDLAKLGGGCEILGRRLKRYNLARLNKLKDTKSSPN